MNQELLRLHQLRSRRSNKATASGLTSSCTSATAHLPVSVQPASDWSQCRSTQPIAGLLWRGATQNAEQRGEKKQLLLQGNSRGKQSVETREGRSLGKNRKVIHLRRRTTVTVTPLAHWRPLQCKGDVHQVILGLWRGENIWLTLVNNQSLPLPILPGISHTVSNYRCLFAARIFWDKSGRSRKHWDSLFKATFM